MKWIKGRKSETHKIKKWALRRDNGQFACIRQDATIPFTAREIGFYFSNYDRALSFNWLLLDSRSQAEWYMDLLNAKGAVCEGIKLRVVEVDVTIKITPKSDSCVKWK